MRVDARAPVRLLPRSTGDLTSVAGLGLATMFLMTAASMGFTVYGPAILQATRGYSALSAGYVVGIEAFAWTAFALAVSNLTGAWRGRMVRVGAASAALGVALFIWVMVDGPFWRSSWPPSCWAQALASPRPS